MTRPSLPSDEQPPEPLPALPTTKHIVSKAMNASRMQMVGTLVAKVVGLLLSLVLFRLLTPQDFGFFTAAVVVTGLASTISNFGLQAFLVQEPNIDDRTMSTTLILDLMLGISMCTILVAGAYGFQSKFRSPVVARVIALYGVNMIALAVARTPQALLKRNLDFRQVAWGDITYTIVSMSSQVLFAWAKFGAICFPLGDMIGVTAKAVYLWRLADFVPRLRDWEWLKAKRILAFGGATMFSSMGSYFANQTDKLLVATRFSAVTTGLYNFGYTQSGLVYNLIVAPQSDVVFSLYAMMRSDRQALRGMFLRMLRAGNFIVLPIYAFALAVAPLIIEVVFGRKWVGAATIFRIFCLDFMLRSFFINISGLQLAFGLAGAAARTKLVNGAIYVGMLLLCSFTGDAVTYAWGYLSATVIVAVINTVANGRLIDLNLFDLLKASATNAAFVAVCIALTLFLSGIVGDMPKLVRLLLLGSVFVASYMALAWWLVPSAIGDVRDFLRGRRKQAAVVA